MPSTCPSSWRLSTVHGKPLNAMVKQQPGRTCCSTPPQARLLQVFRDTEPERVARRGREAVLAVLRSDYMLHAPTNSLLQASC
jgi:hypothetical protein